MAIMYLISSNTFALLAFICGVGTLLFGYLATSLKDKNADELQDELIHKSNKISELQFELIQLQTVGLNKLAHQAGMITGGDSFPVIILTPKGQESPGRFSPEVVVSGRYPLRNLSVQFTVTSSKGSTKSGVEFETLRQMTFSPVDIVFDVTEETETSAMVRSLANNGTWIQEIKFRRTEAGEHQYETIVYPLNERDNVLLSKDFSEDPKVGTLQDLYSTRYQK